MNSPMSQRQRAPGLRRPHQPGELRPWVTWSPDVGLPPSYAGEGGLEAGLCLLNGLQAQLKPLGWGRGARDSGSEATLQAVCQEDTATALGQRGQGGLL